MSLLRTFLLASALAMPMTATYALVSDISAEAAAKPKKEKKAKKATKTAAYKTCGANMYRKDGKCVDARDAKK
jgi:hypothetical protein